jgi:hypothetical protein
VLERIEYCVVTIVPIKLLAVMTAGEDGATPVTVRGRVPVESAPTESPDIEGVPIVTVPVSLRTL